MQTYLKNGTMVDKRHILSDNDEFCIQNVNGKYIYPGDSINYKLDDALVELYDTFRDLYFPDTSEYFREATTLPIYIQEAGQNSDSPLKKDDFMKFLSITAKAIPSIYKHIYLIDCQYLVGTIQNLLIGLEYSFIHFYINLSNTKTFNCKPTTTMMELSSKASEITTLLESYFIKAYSILDMICKIAYEFEYVMDDFSGLKKLKSAKILWGDRKDLQINHTPKTLFDKTKLITMIESLRNEIVHNGSWELTPRIFTSYKNNEITERFVLFPDTTNEGHLETAKNRKHFFGNELKANEILPQIHKEFLQRLLNTLNILNN